MIYVLYGVTDRDRDEKVCQMFADMQTLDEFVNDLPGSYDVMTVAGADYESLNIVNVGDVEHQRQHIGHTVTYITTEDNAYRVYRNRLDDPWTVGKNVWTDTKDEKLYCEDCEVEITFPEDGVSFG